MFVYNIHMIVSTSTSSCVFVCDRQKSCLDCPDRAWTVQRCYILVGMLTAEQHGLQKPGSTLSTVMTTSEMPSNLEHLDNTPSLSYCWSCVSCCFEACTFLCRLEPFCPFAEDPGMSSILQHLQLGKPCNCWPAYAWMLRFHMLQSVFFVITSKAC